MPRWGGEPINESPPVNQAAKNGNGSPNGTVKPGWGGRSDTAAAAQVPVLASLRAARIATTGGDGGAGKTTVASNIAAQLQHDLSAVAANGQEPPRIILVDANIGRGPLAKALRIPASPSWQDWMALSPDDLRRLNWEDVESLLVRHASGFYVLPNRGRAELASVTYDAARRVYEELSVHADVVVFDCAHDLNGAEATLAALETATRVLVVSESDPAGQGDTDEQLAILREVAHEMDWSGVRVVMNKTLPHFPPDIEALEARWGVNIIAQIPFDMAAVTARHERKCIVLSDPQAPCAKALRDLARELVPAAGKIGRAVEQPRGFFGRLRARG